MPFCPNCRYEYRDDVSHCPDCDARLVESLPPLPVEETPSDAAEYKDWVQIARLNSDNYAQMIIEAWQSAEIPGIVLSGTGHFGLTGQMGPSSFRPVGGHYSLLVPREFVVEADAVAGSILGEDWDKSKLINIEEY